MLPLQARVDLEVMAMKGYLHSPKLQHYWNLAIRLFSVIFRTLEGGVLLFCKDAVSISLQPQPTGLCTFVYKHLFANHILHTVVGFQVFLSNSQLYGLKQQFTFNSNNYIYPTPLFGQDMTQGQFLSGV